MPILVNKPRHSQARSLRKQSLPCTPFHEMSRERTSPGNLNERASSKGWKFCTQRNKTLLRLEKDRLKCPCRQRWHTTTQSCYDFQATDGYALLSLHRMACASTRLSKLTNRDELFVPQVMVASGRWPLSTGGMPPIKLGLLRN